MRLERSIAIIALSMLVLNGLPAPVAAQPEWPNCENFLTQDDAQATYDANRDDPFGLEESKPVNDLPCEDEPSFGTQPLVSCDALSEYPRAQQALQGLYDHTRDGGDPYGLDQGGDPAIACDGGGGGDDREVLDGPPPESGGRDPEELDGPPAETSRDDREVLDGPPPVTNSGTTVSVSTNPLGDFDSLEARLDARFAELEADFAAFEVRAENGFGRFDESGDDATSGGESSSGVDSTSRQVATMTQRVPGTNGRIPVVGTQPARGGETVGADIADRQTARPKTKRDRDKERTTGKRVRHKDRARPRR